ncbi:MAG: SLC13 family permease [Bryobacteraceae bacterium]
MPTEPWSPQAPSESRDAYWDVHLGAVSLAALGVAILLSCTTRLNVGLIAIAFSWLIGVYLGGMPVKAIAAGFPSDLFLTLAGVTLLFTQAQVNGTLDRVAHAAVRMCRGNAGLACVSIFLLAAGLASVGPGNIATAALLAPMAMSTASRMKIPAFLMAIVAGNGANAGSLSPFAPTGIIVSGLMTRIGLGGHEARTFVDNLVAHAVMAAGGFLLFGGWRLFGQRGEAPAEEEDSRFEPKHWITIGVIATLILSVLLLRVHVGMAAFAGAVILSLARIADDAEALRRMPWGTIVMVSGVTILIALLEKTAGLDLFTSFVARYATTATIAPLISFVTGIISVYSSTSGVVLPAFLPTIPGLIEKLGGGDPASIASAMNIGGHLVDVSPLSTIGALCVASVADVEESRRLFNRLLGWGLSMTVAGAVYAWLVFA